MKLNLVPTVLSLLLTAALTYSLYSLARDSQDVVMLTVCSALTIAFTLGSLMGVQMTDSRDTVNLKVWSGLMSLVTLVVAFLSAAIGAVSALYIILVTGILVIHILVLWAFYKKKGQDQLQE